MGLCPHKAHAAHRSDYPPLGTITTTNRAARITPLRGPLVEPAQITRGVADRAIALFF